MIKIASHAGFCFGVRRATETVESEIARADSRIYTLGRLIHNDGYNESLRRRGVDEISAADIPDICRRAREGKRITVVIRAHGEIESVMATLRRCADECENLRLIDCTCPYVKKVRRIAAENSGEGKIFLLLGAADHPEVQGIMSCVRGEGIVFSSADELQQMINDGKLCNLDKKEVSVAAQTTQKLAEWEKSLEIIKKVYTNAGIFDTICSVTEERQKEAAAIAEESDVVLVIGSRGSSNTVKLYEICAAICRRTYLIESAAGLKNIRLSRSDRISVTAGASTPLSVIQEVKQTMNEQMTESFEEMLGSTIKTLNPGDIVIGVVTSVSTNEIHLDLGAKTTGVIVHDKLTDDPNAKLADLFKIGDEVKAKVVKVSDLDGIATLDKLRVDSDSNWEKVIAAYEAGETVEGKIVEAVKGGVLISLFSSRVFIPASLTGLPKGSEQEALQALVGTVQKVKIIEIKTERKRAYASMRAVIREERKKLEEAFWNEIEEGKVYEGTVKNLTTYGAFVDLGGVEGMVHISELSWKRIRHPKEVVNTGDKIKVFVKAFDKEKGRISLGYKTEETDPWYIFTHKYAVSDVASVRIVSLMPFGAFAEVVPGADGLIHISQIADHKIAAPADVLSVGDVVDAKIIGVDEDNRKISLSIRALIEKDEEPEDDYDDSYETSGPTVYSTDDPSAYADFGAEDEE